MQRISADVDAAWPETRRRRGARRHVGGEQKLAGSTKKSSRQRSAESNVGAAPTWVTEERCAMMGTTEERYADEGGRAVSREVHCYGEACCYDQACYPAPQFSRKF